jgi:hypothetical protein
MTVWGSGGKPGISSIRELNSPTLSPKRKCNKRRIFAMNPSQIILPGIAPEQETGEETNEQGP